MSVSREELAKCRGCKEAREVRAQDGWGFIGCAMRGRRWIAEIEECEYRDRKPKTILEAARRKYPLLSENDIRTECPSHFGFQNCEQVPTIYGIMDCELECEECWNRLYEEEVNNG